MTGLPMTNGINLSNNPNAIVRVLVGNGLCAVPFLISFANFYKVLANILPMCYTVRWNALRSDPQIEFFI